MIFLYSMKTPQGLDNYSHQYLYQWVPAGIMNLLLCADPDMRLQGNILEPSNLENCELPLMGISAQPWRVLAVSTLAWHTRRAQNQEASTSPGVAFSHCFLRNTQKRGKHLCWKNWRISCVPIASYALLNLEPNSVYRPRRSVMFPHSQEFLVLLPWSLCTAFADMGPHRCQAPPVAAQCFRLLGDFSRKSLDLETLYSPLTSQEWSLSWDHQFYFVPDLQGWKESP